MYIPLQRTGNFPSNPKIREVGKKEDSNLAKVRGEKQRDKEKNAD
jgi:hypothetical protein